MDLQGLKLKLLHDAFKLMLPTSTACHKVKKSFKWDQISKYTVVKFSSSSTHMTAVILILMCISLICIIFRQISMQHNFHMHFK